MQKMFAFSYDKDIDMFSFVALYETCQTSAYTNLLMQICIHLRKELMTFMRNIEKLFLVVHLSFLRKQQLLTGLLFKNQQTYANLLLGLTLTYYTSFWCVNPCRPVCISVGISIQRWVDLRLDKTKAAALKIMSCLIFNEQDQHVKLKDSLQPADRRKLTALVLMALVLIETVCLKPEVAVTTSVPVKKFLPLSLRRYSKW